MYHPNDILVTGIFRQKNSSNTILLLVYALALKFPVFLHPQGPLKLEEDHYLYTGLLSFLDALGFPPIVYAFMAFALIYTQATLFTRICNNQKMMPRPHYLVAMSYILITSLIPVWNRFSAPLLVNSLLIWAIYRMMQLYNNQRALAQIFNIGVMLGVGILFYKPALLFVLLILVALFVMRPFFLREWLIALLGVTTPFYFLGIFLFLTNRWSWHNIFPSLKFGLPAFPGSIYITISILLIVLVFIIGGFFVQDNLNKMLIQVRKNWSLMLLYLIIASLVILLNTGTQYENWLICMVPIAAFHGAAYYYPTSRIFPLVLHWNLFAYAIYVNYWG